MASSQLTRRAKPALLTAVIITSGTVFSSCSLADVRKNLVAGTLDFVAASAESFWGTLVPPWEQIFGIDDGDGE